MLVGRKTLAAAVAAPECHARAGRSNPDGWPTQAGAEEPFAEGIIDFLRAVRAYQRAGLQKLGFVTEPDA